MKTLRFNSETGMPQYDSAARKVYVNLRRTNEIAEIDPATDTVTARFPVEGCEHNHGMAIDSAHHRAFLLCGGNRTFTVVALDSRKAIAHFPLPARGRRGQVRSRPRPDLRRMFERVYFRIPGAGCRSL